MSEPRGKRDCVHGHLARKCPICESDEVEKELRAALAERDARIAELAYDVVWEKKRVEAARRDLAGKDRYIDELIETKNARIAALTALVVKGVAVVEDFMPNIGRCVLQDYGRFNEFLLESAPITDAARKERTEARSPNIVCASEGHICPETSIDYYYCERCGAYLG